MKLALYWVDSFSRAIFRGNPAGVVPLATWLPDETMRLIAFENGFAETAFFVRTGPDRFHLRWFTPAVEVDLCGHATLAAAFVLFTQLGQSGNLVTFDSRSGPLTVTRQRGLPSEATGATLATNYSSRSAKEGGLLELDFPATPPELETDSAVASVITAALGHQPEWLGRSRFDRFAVLPDTAAVRELKPDLAQVAAAGGRGLIVTAPGDGSCDFVSRFFAPQSGVPEDPVTGSAHSALVPYWAARFGKTTLHARQISVRGGELWCEFTGNRVKIAGHAALYLRGEIEL